MNIIQKIRNLDYDGLKRSFQFYLIIIIIIFIIIGFITGLFGIAILPDNDYDSNLLFTLLNVFIYGVFFSFCGFFNKGIRKSYKKYVAILFFILFICGFGLASFEFHINLNIPLWYPTFSTSTIQGAFFFASPLNFAMFCGIFLFSFTIESES